jgi:hypothetical protein
MMRHMPRRCLLLVLLVLLPLRGWAGVAMATSMAATSPMPSATSTAPIMQASTASLDCHDHGSPGAGGSAPVLQQGELDHGPHEAMAVTTPSAMAHDAAQGASLELHEPHAQNAQNEPHAQHDSASCANCVFCQLCHTVALAPPLNGLGLSWEPLSLPQAHLPADLSATPLPGDKPPIT